MNTQSNNYTFLYAIVMVVVVAAVLSYTAVTLKPFQQANRKIEKMRDILKAVKVESTADNAEELFKKYITRQYIVNSNGEELEGKAFDIKRKKQAKLKLEDRKLPIFECNLEGDVKYIIPVRGKGLWGPIWGYIALNEDKNSIFGVTFAHQGETPGLGAEIAEGPFQKQFDNKELFENGKFVSIQTVKAGVPSTKHNVDAISGGTITSVFLQDMLKDCLGDYEKFLTK